MRNKRFLTLLILLGALVLIGSLVQAEDGDLYRRNVSKTPMADTGKAAIYMMDFYVPAQDSTGLVAPVDDYILADEATVAYEPRNYAKPLISVYIDVQGHEEEVDTLSTLGPEAILTGVVFDSFDSFVSYSLDDGDSWRNENISRHADLSSFTLANGIAFPGMSHGLVHQVAEDKILMAWASKFCDSGFPLYSWDPADETYAARLTSLEAGDYMAADGGTAQPKNALYLYDFFGVSGNQGSVDYTLQGHPDVGEIPYSCVWTARGKLLPGDDPKTTDVTEASHIVWAAPERLTSGRRDANLPAVDCAGGAGCALTWQEDPEGLRPGKGLGPGEGWSGAIANAKTDIWYSYITFADFDYVLDEDTQTPMLIEDYELLKGAEMDRPKPYVPMAMPVRITDNDMCRATASTNNKPEDPFCWVDFDSIDDLDHTNIVSFFDNLAAPEADADFCTTSVQWTNPGGTTLDICVTEDGRWMIGRVGSTRVRMILKPYTPAEAPDHDGDGIPDKSAWLSFGAEETKALGVTGDTDGDGVADYDPVDIGKDMMYYSFDYAKPYNMHVNAALDAVDDSAYVVQQGGMLNEPAKCSPWFITTADTNPAITCPGAGEYFDLQEDPFTLYPYYLTEISRRVALTLNNPGNITNPDPTVTPDMGGGSGLSGMLIYKQGIIWQGGPADIMLRRTLVEPFCVDANGDGTWDTADCYDPAVDNPYAYERMECVNPDGSSGWEYLPGTDGRTGLVETNPNYLEGLCKAPAINISGTTIKTCTTGTGNDACAADFPVADDGTIPDDISFENFPKVLEWRNCDGTSTVEGCEGDSDLDDQSWENPYDIAKGHRGFLYGDMVMMMYAWSPNWQANAKGNDHYNLYERRSFDGGVTWTTTPSDWCGPVDGVCGGGTSALEYYYGDTIGAFVPYVWNYTAGQFEQARNLSLLHGNKVTVLDPRYSPGGGLKQYATIRTDWLTNNADLIGYSFEDVLPYPDDAVIDPSKYMVIYETGDNTVDYDVSAATPLDLFYSRATVFGDTLEYFDYTNDTIDCNESDPVTKICIDPIVTVDVEPRFPWLENQQDDLSGEASVVLNPGGTFSYQVWNQWKEEVIDEEHSLVYDSDSIFRRLMYLPDDSTIELAPMASILYLNEPTITAGLDEDLTDGDFTGLIKKIEVPYWSIGNYDVLVTTDTELEGEFRQGDYVKVKFDWDGDIMVATTIEPENDDALVIGGTGRDRDRLGDQKAVKYRWTVNAALGSGQVESLAPAAFDLCALDQVDDDEDGVVECEQLLQLSAHQLPTNTTLTFSFEVQDNEGVWSSPATVTVKVTDGEFYIMLPMVTH